MLSFSLDVGLRSDIQTLAEDALRRVLRSSMLTMQELAIQYAPQDQGQLRAQIDVFPDILADEYTLTSRAPYSEAMEYGTRPFWAPIKPLLEWSKRQLGDESAAYAVQAKIAKVGIRAHPYMRPAYHQVQNYWVSYYAAREGIA